MRSFHHILPTVVFGALAMFSAILAGDALPPIAPDGSALFSYQNNSGKNDEQIFLQVTGVNPHTNNQCFIIYNSEGTPSYFDVLEKVDSRDFAYSLAHFPDESAGSGKTLYLPTLNGARLYTSINKKLEFLVVQNDLGQWTIAAPNPLNPSDPNRNIIWDKTEFAVNPEAIFINPTAVDNFSLPLYSEETGKDGSKQSGGIKISRKTVFNDIKKAFHRAGSPWTHLISGTPSLIYSPIYGAATGVFPRNLMVKTGWLNAFKDVFSATPLLIDAEESLPVDKGGGIWQGIIDPVTNIITLVRIVDERHPAVPPAFITLPINIDEILAGTGPSWNIEPGNELQLVFARNLCCAIETNTLSTTEALNQTYFKQHAAEFYLHNPQLPKALQFIDHYSKVLHSYGDHQIYTFPYDDELGQSGAASYVPENYAGGTIILGPLFDTRLAEENSFH